MLDVAESVEIQMANARSARSRGDLVDAQARLESAWLESEGLPELHPLRAIVAWRRVKVAFDRDAIGDLVRHLDDAMALPEPFDTEGAALRAAQPVARRIWDTLGYGQPNVEPLWQAFITAWQQAGDPWMAASGRTQLAWEWACVGRLDALAELVESTACLDPHSFGAGPSRHPLAPDAPSAVWFAQMDQARVALRGAVWGRHEALARIASELYADALAEAEREEDEDPWFLETVGRAEQTFGWSPRVSPRWERSAPAATHARAPLHASIAAADEAGPEWAVDVRRLAVDLAGPSGDPRAAVWREESTALVRRYGVHVFPPLP